MTFLKKTTNRRVGSFFAVAALLLATITPGLVPAFASAAQLSERSVTLSSSSKEATAVQYEVTFEATETGAGAVVLEFCENSPLIDSTCDAPAGFDVSAATAAGFTPTALTAARDNARVFTGTIVAPGAATTIPVAGITNPDDAGTLYVRISTFATAGNAQAYVSTAVTTATGAVDQGSAAVSITDSIGVSAGVNETLTFCVSGAAIVNASCDAANNGAELTAPIVKLGDPTTGALDADSISEGDVYSQISTNALGGAVVNLKSGNECGGLKLSTADDDDCGIAAAAASPVATQSALFGLKLTLGGSLAIAGGGSPFYTTGTYKLDYTSGGASGVTSPFGNSLFTTNDGPVLNQSAQVTFGASIANDTPAGLYSNDYSLIATGKF